MVEYLRQAGFPETLVNKTKSDLLPEYQEKFRIWKQAVNRERPVTVVTGPRSEQKDLLIMLMAREFVKLSKSVAVVDDLMDVENLPQAFLIVVMLADLQATKNIPIITSWLSRQIYHGKALILDVENVFNIKQRYGESFANLIETKQVEVSVPKVEVEAIVI